MMRRPVLVLTWLGLSCGMGLVAAPVEAGCGPRGGGRTYHYNGRAGYYTTPALVYAQPVGYSPVYAQKPAYAAPVRPAYTPTPVLPAAPAPRQELFSAPPPPPG